MRGVPTRPALLAGLLVAGSVLAACGERVEFAARRR